MKITTVLSVAGDQKYFDFAASSVPSFVRACPGSRLVIYTDCINQLLNSVPSICNDKNVDVLTLDILPSMEAEAAKIHNGIAREYIALRNHDRIHYHFEVAILPVLSRYLAGDFILKIDADMFFVGDFMETILKEMNPDADFQLVERVHPLMKRIGRDLPGVGFALWHNDGRFVREYVERFRDNEQATMQNIFFHPDAENDLYCYLIKNSALHFVYPFWQGDITNRPFTKADAEQVRAGGGMAIHCGGPNVEKQMETLKEWYK